MSLTTECPTHSYEEYTPLQLQLAVLTASHQLARPNQVEARGAHSTSPPHQARPTNPCGPTKSRPVPRTPPARVAPGPILHAVTRHASNRRHIKNIIVAAKVRTRVTLLRAKQQYQNATIIVCDSKVQRAILKFLNSNSRPALLLAQPRPASPSPRGPDPARVLISPPARPALLLAQRTEAFKNN
ncbi:unnamed protein product [Linum trigynum]|uniref:Uncharacterized protein n=1 Tax=Linum trigynum TaxID=586398 RepID=A0AAV2FT98_9ROSI